jgi:hypothetical protein
VTLSNGSVQGSVIANDAGDDGTINLLRRTRVIGCCKLAGCEVAGLEAVGSAVVGMEVVDFKVLAEGDGVALTSSESLNLLSSLFARS